MEKRLNLVDDLMAIGLPAPPRDACFLALREGRYHCLETFASMIPAGERCALDEELLLAGANAPRGSVFFEVCAGLGPATKPSLHVMQVYAKTHHLLDHLNVRSNLCNPKFARILEYVPDLVVEQVAEDLVKKKDWGTIIAIGQCLQRRPLFAITLIAWMIRDIDDENMFVDFHSANDAWMPTFHVNHLKQALWHRRLLLVGYIANMLPARDLIPCIQLGHEMLESNELDLTHGQRYTIYYCLKEIKSHV